jgi:hypothetical protein
MKLSINNIDNLTYVESGLSTVIKKGFLTVPDLRLIYLDKLQVLKR